MKECDICHYWYFKDIGFKYKPCLCNGCHDLMQKAMSFNDASIIYVNGSSYRNKDVILNRPKDYYENDKERLREHARDKCRNLSEEERNIKREYGKNRYHNMSEEKKANYKRISKKLL